MPNEFDIPAKGCEQIPVKKVEELVKEAIEKIDSVPVPASPETPKLSSKDAIQVLKRFLLNEGAGIATGNFGGWQLYLKIIIVLGILAAIIFA